MQFKDKLKFVRAELLITQSELAKELGVSFCTINRLENGKNQPNFLTQKRLEYFCRKNNVVFEEENI